MVEIRIAGLPTASDLGEVSANVGADSGSVQIPAYQSPSAARALPRISNGFDTDTLTVDTTGLTNVTAYEWRDVSDASVLSTAATLTGTGQGGKYVECETTSDEGVRLSPPIMVYSSTMMMMGGGMPMTMDASHLYDDAAILFVVPHSQATHIAVANGDWTAKATWHNGEVPRNGARVLVPHGIEVRYNENRRYRLDWVRVDGKLTWALDQDTRMLVETMVGTRGSEIIMGTSENRLPAQYTMRIMISGRDYSQNSFESTDMNLTRDPDLWGRGIIAQGVWRAWGADKLMWSDADPMDVGATGAWLHKVPTGWAVGDEIVISGTSVDYVKGPSNNGAPMIIQDEIRTITDITGSVVSWAEPLIHPHKNQLTGSTRTDLYPKIMLKGCRNIKIHGEARSKTWQRGHTAHVHHSCTVDMWDVEFIGLGRTDKSTDVGKKDENEDFLYHDNSGGNTLNGLTTVPFTAQSNIASRYPMHMHHVGFAHMGARPIVHSCYIENSPGWCVSHHQCDVDLVECGMYEFWGAGMVAESGNELGGWIDNIAGYSTATADDGSLYFNAKNREGAAGLTGNNFKGGYGFAYRGRAVRATRNVAFSCAWGHTFYHRSAGGQIFPTASLDRRYIDLKEVALASEPSTVTSGFFRFVDYPIIHFKDNEAVACLGGLNITKQSPQASNDVNVKLKNFKAWGFLEDGADIEYIGNYILDKFDIVGQDGSSVGIRTNPNVIQFANVNARVEGCNLGYRVNLSVTEDSITPLLYNLNDPRFLQTGLQFVDCATNFEFLNESQKSGALVTYIDDDFDNTAVDYDLDPSETLPDVLGDWDTGFTLSNVATNADGKKITNASSGMEILPKKSNEFVFPDKGSKLLKYADDNELDQGYWQIDIGNGTENFLLVRDIISDSLTGRPFRYRKLYRMTGTVPGNIRLNGSFDFSGPPTQQANTLATVAKNGTVNIDVVTGATGGGGNTYTLTDAISIKPDHGIAVLNTGTGVVTYTPDSNFFGTDEMYVFVEGENKTSATVRIDILVGAGGAVSAPTVPTVTDHADANTIGVELLAPPSTGGRRIDLVQYSTDAGATWRRLTHGWVQAVHKVTVESDGTAISAGSYDVQIRYKTNYDYTVSAASTRETVTVT